MPKPEKEEKEAPEREAHYENEAPRKLKEKEASKDPEEAAKPEVAEKPEKPVEEKPVEARPLVSKEVKLEKLEKPEAKPPKPKLKSGIPGLDDLMEGGFEPKSVILVSGDPGSGKTTFALQFLYAGATQYNEPGVFITFEEGKEDVFRHMESFGWRLEDLVNQRKLAILEYPPHEIERFIIEGDIIRDIVIDVGAKRLAIDSMSSFAMLFNSPYKLRQGILKILAALKKWGCTILVTSEGVRSEKGEVGDRFGLEYLTDGFIYLYNIREAERRERLLEIIELKGTSHDTNIHEVFFSKKGIEVNKEPWLPRKEARAVEMRGWE